MSWLNRISISEEQPILRYGFMGSWVHEKEYQPLWHYRPSTNRILAAWIQEKLEQRVICGGDKSSSPSSPSPPIDDQDVENTVKDVLKAAEAVAEPPSMAQTWHGRRG